MSAPPDVRTRRPIRSLRRRVGRTFLATLVLLVVLLAVIFAALVDLQRKGDEVVDRWQPAFTLSQDVLSDLVNQETGVRGYALSRERSLLAPYTEYYALEQRQQKTLRGLLSGRDDLLSGLTAVEAAAQNWRTSFAQPFIDRVRAGDPSVGQDAAGPLAKAAFDRIRAVSANLTAKVRSTRAAAERERATARRYLLAALLVTAALMAVVGVLLWRGLRRAVLEPIESLAAQTRAVAAGNVSRRILPGGPPEIEALGSDVDAMRARIAAELATVEAARAELLARYRGSRAVERRPRAVRLRRVARPVRAAAQGRELLPAARAAVRRPARRQGQAVHRLRRGRCETDADPHRRSARVLAGRQVDGGVHRRRPGRRRGRGPWPISTQRLSEAGAEIVRAPLPTVRGDASLLTALFQNLIANSVKYRGAGSTTGRDLRR